MSAIPNSATYSRSSSAEGAQTPQAPAYTWLLLLTTYGVIASGVLLLAIAERTMVYFFAAVVLCGAHALVVGRSGGSFVSGPVSHIMAIGALGLALFQTYILQTHLSFAAAHFLLFVQIIKLYEARWSRDLRLIQVIAFFQLVVAGTWAVELVFLPAFILAALCIMASLMAFTIHPPFGAERRGPRTAGGLRSIRLKHFMAAMVVPSLLVAVATVVLFVFLPRFRVRRSRMLPMLEPISGFSENVSLREIGTLRQSDRVVFRARFYAADTPGQEPIEPPRVLMRGTSLPAYRNGQWFSHSDALRAALRSGSRMDLQTDPDFNSRSSYNLRDVSVESRLVLQRVQMEARPSGLLFALYRPRRVRGSYENLVESDSHRLTVPFNSPLAQNYEVFSFVPEFRAEQLREMECPDRVLPWVGYWMLPDSIVPQLRAVAAEIDDIYTPRTDYDRMIAVRNYLLDPLRFQYTFELPDYGTEDPVVAFLTRTHRGSCEHFSSAMALLLRVWGIPTRLAVGFKHGDFSSPTGERLFRDMDAHAWVEVYFNDMGWVEVDPTPAAAFSERSRQRQIGILSRVLLELKSSASRTYRKARLQWGGSVLGYNRSRQERARRALSAATSRFARDSASFFRALWPGGGSGNLLDALVSIASVVLVAGGLYYLLKRTGLLSRLRFARRHRPRTVREYEDLLALLRKKGLARAQHATPREFADSVAACLNESESPADVQIAAVRLITDFYYEMRFGGRSLTVDEERQVAEALAALRGLRRLSRSPRVLPPPEPA